MISGGTVTAAGQGQSRGFSGIFVGGIFSEIMIGEDMLVMAGDSEKDAVDVTDKYRGRYTKRLTEEWVKIGRPVTERVSFRVVNGSWNDGTAAEKTVDLKGFEGDPLKLAAGQIPAAGNNPDSGYKAGSWDISPDTETAITADTAYTYTYIKEDAAPAPAGDPTAVGTTHAVDGSMYVVTAPGTVSLVKAPGKKSFTLPGTVRLYGKTFTVTGIYAKAFRGTKVKTLTVKTRMLTKRSVRGVSQGLEGQNGKGKGRQEESQ